MFEISIHFTKQKVDTLHNLTHKLSSKDDNKAILMQNQLEIGTKTIVTQL